MIDKGMDNGEGMLQGLIDIADKRIAEIRSGEKPALGPMKCRNILPKWWSIWT
jgi:aconitate hydratase 2/2-methylisocitrate dehydratase